MTFPSRSGLALALAVVVAATASACGGGSSTSPGGDEHDASFADSSGGDSAAGSDTGADATGNKDTGVATDATSSSDAGVDATSMDAGTDAGLDSSGGMDAPVETGPTCPTPGLDIEPSTLQTITVPAGATTPTVTFTATFDCKPVNAGWSVDKANVGTVPSIDTPTGLFTPSGTTGGLVTITSGVNGTNGPAPGAGQARGLAERRHPGRGPARYRPPPASSPRAAASAASAARAWAAAVTTCPTTAPCPRQWRPGLSFLYPYDKTVWPRGLLAPLLMWTWTHGRRRRDPDRPARPRAARSPYTGTFGRPAILTQTGGKFVRDAHPAGRLGAATSTRRAAPTRSR